MSNDFLNSKIYKTISFILNAGIWVAILFTCISLIGFILNPTQTFVSTGILFDGFTIENPILFDSMYLHSLLFLIMLVTLSTGLICIFLLRNIINSLKSNSPFHIKTVNRLRIIGWTLFILGSY